MSQVWGKVWPKFGRHPSLVPSLAQVWPKFVTATTWAELGPNVGQTLHQTWMPTKLGPNFARTSCQTSMCQTSCQTTHTAPNFDQTLAKLRPNFVSNLVRTWPNHSKSKFGPRLAQTWTTPKSCRVGPRMDVVRTSVKLGPNFAYTKFARTLVQTWTWLTPAPHVWSTFGPKLDHA